MAKKRKAWEGDGWALDRGIQQHPITAVQRLYLLDRLKQVSNRVELRELAKEVQQKLPIMQNGSGPKKKAKASKGYVTAGAAKDKIEASVLYWSCDAVVELQLKQDTAAAKAKAAASPAPSIQLIADAVRDARLKVEDASAMLGALQATQDEADAMRTEVQPRRRATHVETNAKEALTFEALALFTAVASLLFARMLVHMCKLSAGLQNVFRDAATWIESVQAARKDNAIHADHIPSLGSTTAPATNNTVAAAAAAAATAAMQAAVTPAAQSEGNDDPKELWEIAQVPLPPFAEDWNPTWADEGLKRFHLLDVRSEYGAARRPMCAVIIEVLYLLRGACLRHTKPSANYVDRDLKEDLAIVMCDRPLMRKKDKRVALWLRNFRQHIAEHFDGLGEHVLNKKNGVSKDRLPVYRPFPA